MLGGGTGVGPKEWSQYDREKRGDLCCRLRDGKRKGSIIGDERRIWPLLQKIL